MGILFSVYIKINTVLLLKKKKKKKKKKNYFLPAVGAGLS